MRRSWRVAASLASERGGPKSRGTRQSDRITPFSAAGTEGKSTMKFRRSPSALYQLGIQSLVAFLCCLLVVPDAAFGASMPTQEAAPADQAAAKIPPDQLDTLVAPIALYPDALLSQTLMASTYPLEVIQLQQWLQKNPTLKEKDLADAVGKQ